MARILVVDDEPRMVELIRSVLTIEGYEVDEASDGTIALARLGVVEAVKSAPLPDLIILDLVMPGLDGYTVASRLQKHPATQSIPVVVFTGKEQMKDFFKTLPNVKGFLEKPFDLQELVGLVTRLTAER